LSAATDCFVAPAACYTPSQFRVAYGIQPLLDSGTDGRGETITDLETAVSVNFPPGSTIIQAGPTGTATTHVTVVGPPGQPPAITDIRQDLSSVEVGDLDELHMVAPAATLRVVLMPADIQTSAKAATAGLLAGLRLAVSDTDVVSVSWDLGEHFFTKAQAAELNSILQGAAADHVTVVASTGDTGPFSDMQAFASTAAAPGTPVKEVSLPASDPWVLAVGGTTLTANPATGASISETAWNTSASFSQPGSASGAASATCTLVPPIRMASPGSGR
jgi:subtilase family serine protease